eukprot:29026-Pelagococcus_subviridis.AAC.7
MFCADSIATIVRISSEHPKSTAAMSILLIGGSSGNSAIFRPSRVRSPSSSNAPRLYSCSSALTSVCGGGGSMKSKFRRSLIPIAFIVSVVVPRFERWISGTDVPSISFLYADSVYSRKHFPGPVLPARPARCLALACEMGATTRESMPILGLNTFCFANPGSTT